MTDGKSTPILVNEQESDAEYCAELVMKHDRDRLLCVMFAPFRRRSALIALLAWNYEIAKVGEVVSDMMVGLIRFQWWRDALDEIYDAKPVREHSVALELAKAVNTFQLPREAFEAILTAREADLEPAPFATLQDLENYASASAGPLAELWLKVLGADTAADREAALNVATTWALVGTLRGIHYQAHRGRVCLPGIDAQKLLQQGFDEEVRASVRSVCQAAEQKLAAAHALRKDVSQAALPALLPALLAEDYLRRIIRADYNPLLPEIEKGRAKRAFSLWLGKWRKRY